MISNHTLKSIIPNLFLFLLAVLPLSCHTSPESNDGSNKVVNVSLVDQANEQYKQRNYTIAVQLFEQAAKDGNPKAQYNYAVMLLNGEGISKDELSAIKWFTAASENGQTKAKEGIVQAQFELGKKYYFGTGVPKDINTAVKWFSESAEYGHKGSQINLCKIFITGMYQQAFKWCQLAAQQGDADCQYNLGFLYVGGAGTQQSIPRALPWLEKALQQGSADAKKVLDALKKEGSLEFTEYDFKTSGCLCGLNPSQKVLSLVPWENGKWGFDKKQNFQYQPTTSVLLRIGQMTHLDTKLKFNGCNPTPTKNGLYLDLLKCLNGLPVNLYYWENPTSELSRIEFVPALAGQSIPMEDVIVTTPKGKFTSKDAWEMAKSIGKDVSIIDMEIKVPKCPCQAP